MRSFVLSVLLLSCSAHEGSTAADAGSTTDDSGADSSPDGAAEAATLRLGMTVHLEEGGAGWQFFDDEMYATYTDRLRSYGATFVKHGAKLTFEPREQLVAQVAMRGDSIFDELAAMGHSFGSHAAAGAEADLTYESFVATLTDRRESLERVADSVEHVSGNCSELDWVSAVADAGFGFTTGTTVYCLLSMPPDARPPEYQDLECTSAVGECHASYPSEISERVHPWRPFDGASWLTHNDKGPIVIIPGAGTLPCLEEEAAGTSGACTLTDGDVKLSLGEVDQAIGYVDANLVNTFYFVWSFGIDLEEASLDAWLTAIDDRVAAGTIVWNTVNEMVQAYVEWEETH